MEVSRWLRAWTHVRSLELEKQFPFLSEQPVCLCVVCVCVSVRFREVQRLFSITQRISSPGTSFSPNPVKNGDFPGMVVIGCHPDV